MIRVRIASEQRPQRPGSGRRVPGADSFGRAAGGVGGTMRLVSGESREDGCGRPSKSYSVPRAIPMRRSAFFGPRPPRSLAPAAASRYTGKVGGVDSLRVVFARCGDTPIGCQRDEEG